MADKIVLNGKEYNSIEEMPEDVRKTYQTVTDMFADKNQNGIPDIFEGTVPARTSATLVTETKYQYKGQVYSCLEDMPEEVRHIFEKGLHTKVILHPEPAEAPEPAPTARQPIAPMAIVQSAIGSLDDEPRRLNRKWLFAGLIVFDLLVLLGAVLYFTGSLSPR
jgi:hypothetical protein